MDVNLLYNFRLFKLTSQKVFWPIHVPDTKLALVAFQLSGL